MVTLVLGIYLLLVGLVQTFSLPISGWIMGLFALVAGVLLILEASNNYHTRGV